MRSKWFLGIAGALIAGIGGVLLVMIIASIQRNICFAAVNSRKILHNGVRFTVTYQILMLAVVCFGGFIGYKLMNGMEFSLFSLTATAGLTFIVECVCCAALFLAADFGSGKILLRKLKTNT